MVTFFFYLYYFLSLLKHINITFTIGFSAEPSNIQKQQNQQRQPTSTIIPTTECQDGIQIVDRQTSCKIIMLSNIHNSFFFYFVCILIL